MRRILVLFSLLAFYCGQNLAADVPPEARQWAAAGKTPPPARYTEAVGQLIARMQAEQLWDKCGLLLFFAAHEATTEAFNLKGGGTVKLVGGVEHQPGRAIKGNGVDGSVDTGVQLQNVPGFELQRHGFYVFVTDDMPGGFTAAGAAGGGTAIAIRPRNLSSLGVYTGVTAQMTARNFPSGVGLAGYSRFSESDGIWVKDQLSGALGLTPAAWPKSTLRILRHGASTAFFPGGVAFVWAGAPLEAREAAVLSGLFDECLKTLGTLDTIRVPLAPPYTGPGAFTRADLAEVKPQGMKIFCLTAPPATDATDATDEKAYYHFPLHYAVCRPWTATGSTSTKVKCLELIWSDRALGPKPGVISDIPFKKGNDTQGVITMKRGTGRTEFESYELAIGSTLGRTAWTAGLKPFDDERCVWEGKAMGWCDWLEMWGYDVAAWRALAKASDDVTKDPAFITDANLDTGGIVMHRAWVAANAEKIFTQPAFTGGTIFAKRNIVILGQARACDEAKFAGFLMDLEHADGRSPELFARSMEMWAHIIHSVKNAEGSPRFLASCSAHHLDGGTGKLAGWDASTAWRVHAALEFTCINAGGAGLAVDARVQSQLNVLRGSAGDKPVDLGRIMLQTNIGIGRDQLKLEEARAVHDWLEANPTIGGLFIAPVAANFKAPRADIVNRLRATILGLTGP